MLDNKITHSITLGISSLLVLYFGWGLVVGIIGSVEATMVYWSFSKASVLALIGISVVGWLVPLMILLSVVYISYSFLKGKSVSTNKAKVTSIFLDVVMVCLILLLIGQFSTSNKGDDGLGWGILFEYVSVIALIPFVIYYREFRKGKK